MFFYLWYVLSNPELVTHLTRHSDSSNPCQPWLQSTQEYIFKPVFFLGFKNLLTVVIHRVSPNDWPQIICDPYCIHFLVLKAYLLMQKIQGDDVLSVSICPWWFHHNNSSFQCFQFQLMKLTCVWNWWNMKPWIWFVCTRILETMNFPTDKQSAKFEHFFHHKIW